MIQSAVTFVAQNHHFVIVFVVDLFSLFSSKKLDIPIRLSEVEAELLTLVGSWSRFSSASVPGGVDRLALVQLWPFS